MACYQHNTLSAENKPRLLLSAQFTRRSIVSYGVMLYARDTGRWLLVQRKHSVEFILLLRGNYRYSHLPIITTHLTRDEAQTLAFLISSGPLTYSRYLERIGLEVSSSDHGYSQLKTHSSTLRVLLGNVAHHEAPLWTWPKGRCEIGESPFSSAKREFEEETGVPFPSGAYVSPAYYSQTLLSLQGTDIVTRCWLCSVEREFALPRPRENPEVIASDWSSTESLPKFLGPTGFLPVTYDS